MLDGMEENKKAVQAVRQRMEAQVRDHQEAAEKQMNRLRTDMARMLAPALAHPTGDAPRAAAAAAHLAPAARGDMFAAAPDDALAAPSFRPQLVGEAPPSAERKAVLPDPDGGQGDEEDDARAEASSSSSSVYKPSQRLSPSGAVRRDHGGDETIPVDLGCKRQPPSPLVPRLTLKRCVSDDAVPASLRCAAIVVGKRLMLFPKGRDGMCDLQFAMVDTFSAASLPFPPARPPAHLPACLPACLPAS